MLTKINESIEQLISLVEEFNLTKEIERITKLNKNKDISEGNFEEHPYVNMAKIKDKVSQMTETERFKAKQDLKKKIEDKLNETLGYFDPMGDGDIDNTIRGIEADEDKLKLVIDFTICPDIDEAVDNPPKEMSKEKVDLIKKIFKKDVARKGYSRFDIADKRADKILDRKNKVQENLDEILGILEDSDWGSDRGADMMKKIFSGTNKPPEKKEAPKADKKTESEISKKEKSWQTDRGAETMKKIFSGTNKPPEKAQAKQPEQDKKETVNKGRTLPKVLQNKLRDYEEKQNKKSVASVVKDRAKETVSKGINKATEKTQQVKDKAKETLTKGVEKKQELEAKIKKSLSKGVTKADKSLFGLVKKFRDGVKKGAIKADSKINSLLNKWEKRAGKIQENLDEIYSVLESLGEVYSIHENVIVFKNEENIISESLELLLEEESDKEDKEDDLEMDKEQDESEEDKENTKEQDESEKDEENLDIKADKIKDMLDKIKDGEGSLEELEELLQEAKKTLSLKAQ